MPDIAVLPMMADFFGISLDSLLLHDASQRKQEMKEFAGHIHDLADSGNMSKAYETLKESIEKWALSASMNHLMSWAAFKFSKEKVGEERTILLEDALMYADRAIRLNGGETSKTSQAKMTKCYCMADLGRTSEAIKIAGTLPSLFSSRERVLALISSGSEQKSHAETALQFLEEIKTEMERIL